MKKVFFVFVSCLFILFLFSCKGEKNLTPVYNSFYSDELLESFHFENLPKIENLNSLYYKEESNKIYLNLTLDEYNLYLDSVASYLLNKDGIFNIGLYYETDVIPGPMFLPCDVEVYIPLIDNLDSFSKNNKFGFSLDEEVKSGWISNKIDDVYGISIIYEEGLLKKENFNYNVQLVLEEVSYASFDTCRKEHLYEKEITLLVPTTIYKVTYSYCKYCGNETQNYHYGDYNALYSINIISGKEYLESSCLEAYNNFPKCYVGLKYYIKLPELENTTYKVIINGFEMPLTYIEDNCFVYGFVMPYFDIQIEIIKVTE